jgi:hypothetical protein
VNRERVGVDAVEFGKLIAILTTLKRREPLSEYDIQIYDEQLIDIPIALLKAGLVKWMRESDGWCLTVPEWRQAAEAARLDMRSSLKHEPCEQCSLTPGWATVVDPQGCKRLERCDCWKSHLVRVQALGAGSEPLALPAASSAPDDEEMVEFDARAAVSRIAGRKRMP